MGPNLVAEPIIVDPLLSDRLEQTEGLAGTRFAEARSRISPEVNSCWQQMAGAYAIYDGPQSPLTQSFRLGLGAEVLSSDLAEIEDFFRSRGAPVFHEVSPLAPPTLIAILNERGYRPIEFTAVMCMRVEEGLRRPPRTDSPISVRRMEQRESDRWAQTSVAGWSEYPEFSSFLMQMGRVFAHAEGATPFFAELHGEPIGTGVICISNKIALIAGASTIPKARKQGAQNALLHARLQFAADQGCEYVMMCAAPGSASQRNAQRNGFQIAYTRIKWQLFE